MISHHHLSDYPYILRQQSTQSLCAVRRHYFEFHRSIRNVNHCFSSSLQDLIPHRLIGSQQEFHAHPPSFKKQGMITSAEVGDLWRRLINNLKNGRCGIICICYAVPSLIVYQSCMHRQQIRNFDRRTIPLSRQNLWLHEGTHEQNLDLTANYKG